MAPYLGYDSDTTFIPGTLNTSSSLTIQGGGITQTGGDVNLDSGTLFIDEDLNRVGIGTTSPGETLTVDSGASVGQVIVSRFRGNASGATGQVINILTSNLESGAELQAYSLSTTNNNAALLNLNDAIVLRSSSATSGGIAFTTANSTAPLIFATDSSERLRITPTGNVGIGTTNPGSKLHIFNGDLELTGGYNLSWGGTFSGGNPTIWGNASNKTIRFAPDGNTTGLVALLGASSSYILGNVGIGTTNPGYTLDVQGSQNVTAQISLWGRTIGQPQTLVEPGRIYATSAGLGPGNLLLQPTGGNLGIGTDSPSQILHVHAPVNDLAVIRLSGTAVLQTPYNIRQGIVGVSNSGFSIYDVTATATRLAIDSAGNVGIGISNPSIKLDVNGSIRAYSTTVGSPPYVVLTYDVTPANGAAHGRIAVSNSGQSPYSGKIHLQPQYYNGSAYDYLTNGLVVDATGNVGIGIGIPTRKLDVEIQTASLAAGSVLNSHPIAEFINLSGGGSRGLEIGSPADSVSSPVYLKVSGTGNRFAIVNQSDSEQFTILSSGNVGIGTTNPAARLDVKSQINLTNSTNTSRPALTGTYFGYSPSSYPVIQIGGASAGYNTVSIGYDPSSNANGAFTGDGSEVVFRNGVKFITPNSADTGWHLAMLCMKDGNVGIGTTEPSTKLHVRQSADFDGITLTHASRAGIWKIYHSGTASENIAFVQNNGTSDAVSYVAGRDAHTWYTGGTFKMLITSAGSVGVGTDDPLGKLSVSGSTDSRLLNVAEGSTSRFLINGSTASVDAGNAVFYTGAGFDASHYMVLQNNTNSYGRVGLVIRGKTFNGANTPTTNDGWSMGGRSGIKFDAYLAGDAGFDAKFAIQHLLANGTNNSIGDLGILAKGYSTAAPAVIITAAGNVGIGSANPPLKFAVLGSNTVAKIESTTTYVDIQLANSQSSSGYIQYLGGNLRFFASSGSTPTLTITGGSPGRVGIGITNPSVGFEAALEAYFSAAEPISGGFGARSTGGTEDWNHATNARSGGGWSLLMGTNANGPGSSFYFHPFSFEYGSKDGGGNMTQFAIGYNTTVVYFRFRYNNVWSSWAQL